MKTTINAKQYLGKSVELYITSLLLDEGREVLVPTVDDHGVDLVVKTREFIPCCEPKEANDFEYQEIQIKSYAGTNDALFVLDIKHPKPNYWFIFYVKVLNTLWIINSMEITKSGKFSKNKTGNNIGKYNVNLMTSSLNLCKKTEKYIVIDFNIIP